MATVNTAGNAFSLYNTSNGVLPEASKEMEFLIEAHEQDTIFLKNEGPLFRVNGFLSEEISYSSQAQYDNITTPVAPDHLLYRAFKDESQRSIATYGYLTKKTYSNSSSQSITLKFRAVSHNRRFITCSVISKNGSGSTNPKDIAKSLMSLTMNTVGKNAIFNFTSPGNTKFGKAIKNSLAPAVIASNVSINAMGSPFGVSIDQPTTMPESKPEASNHVDNSITKYAIDMLTAKNPLVVRLRIGDIFDKDYMVVKSVDVTFSKEFYQKGVPLYGDFTVTLESLFNSSNQEDPNQENIFGTGLSTNPEFKVVVE